MGKFTFGWGDDGGTLWTTANSLNMLPGSAGSALTAQPLADMTRTLHEAFTFSRLQWGDNANSSMTGKQLRLFKNGSASGLTATGPDSDAGPNWLPTSYTGGPVSFAVDDTLTYSGALSNDANNGITPYAFNTTIEASGKQVALYTHLRFWTENLFGITARTLVYNAICSGSVTEQENANQGIYVVTPGTWKHASIWVVSNPASDEVRIKSHVVRAADGATEIGGLDITIPAGETGEFKDTSGTVVLLFGDKIQWECTIATHAAVTVSWIGCSIESTANGQSDLMSHIAKEAASELGRGTRTYLKPYGQFDKDTGGTISGGGFGFDCILKGLWFDVEVNNLDSDDKYEFGFTVEGVNQPVSLTINQASGTGFIHESDQSNQTAIGKDEEVRVWFEGTTTEPNTIFVRAYGYAVDDTGLKERVQAFIA